MHLDNPVFTSGASLRPLPSSNVAIKIFPDLQPYQLLLDQMRAYTQARDINTADALWVLAHSPVFTQGQAGKSEHILDPGNIPVVQSDRGGQVTYHGPGQLIVYTLFDLKRLNCPIKRFVQKLERSVITWLKTYDIEGKTREGAPGVYVEDAKICSLGLRIRKGAAYHGLALNIDMDLTPFSRINPCGFKQLNMTQLKHYIPTISFERAKEAFIPTLLAQLTE